MKNHRKKKVCSILIFRPFHIPIKLCLFVLYLTLRDLSFPIWHFQRKVAAIACRKQILAGNVVMMPHFVIGFGKRSTALCTCCRVLIVCLLYSCQQCHVPVVSEYTRYYFTLSHHMLLKLVHYPRSTVDEGLGLIFKVLANSMTRKATHSMLVNDIGCFYNVYQRLRLPRALRGSEKIQNHKLDKTVEETGPLCCGMLQYIFSGF